MRITPYLLALPMLLPLAGCTIGGTFQPRVVSAGPSGITYRISPDRLDETTTAAVAYCAGRGGQARLDRVTPNGDGKSSAIYVCG